MKTATMVRGGLKTFNGDARLYRLSEPVTWTEYDVEGEREHATDHVIVSAVVAMFSGPETYIFPANNKGEIINWSELNGSFKGDLDHAQALRNAGYEVTS